MIITRNENYIKLLRKKMLPLLLLVSGDIESRLLKLRLLQLIFSVFIIQHIEMV